MFVFLVSRYTIAKYDRKIRDESKILLDWLPHCYFYQKDVACFDTSIFFDWVKNFIKETKFVRNNEIYLLLIIDSYSTHVPFNALSHLKENRFMVIGMLSHIYHVLQPIEVYLFSSFNGKSSKEFQRLAC